jgi:hypothetical protein
MSHEQREDFERRLLALVRSQLDSSDERYPDGWVITDFVVTARGYFAPEPGTSLDPWAGGAYPGWGIQAWTRGSSPLYSRDAELLREALEFTNTAHNEWLERLRAQADEDELLEFEQLPEQADENDEADEH